MAPQLCPNCDSSIDGAYCSSCGQRAELHLDIRGFSHDAVHEFLHLDGKIVQTVRLLLFKPGELTREFLAGRRARYISPIRLYLTFSVLFFALSAVIPMDTTGIIRVGTTNESSKGIRVGTGIEAAGERIEAGARKAEEDASRLGNELLKQAPRVTFALMPLFALFCWALFRRQQRYYIAHLYYSIHFHAFFFALLSVYSLLAVAGLKLIGAPMLLLIVVYHFIALRRVFGGSKRTIAWKGLVLGFGYVALTAAAVVAMTLRILASLGS